LVSSSEESESDDESLSLSLDEETAFLAALPFGWAYNHIMRIHKLTRGTSLKLTAFALADTFGAISIKK